MRQVERTHKRLGNLVAFALTASVARKCMMVVAPAGTGKTVASKIVMGLLPQSKVFDSVTRSSMAAIKELFQDYSGLLVVDDMGKVDTLYSRIATATTFAELCYSGFIEKHTISSHVSISGFIGSAWLGIQPIILGQVIASGEWEAVIMDKTIRYYHLYRPLAPNRTLPSVYIGEPLALDDVGKVKTGGEGWEELAEMMTCQWSDARLMEHLTDLVRAVAAWDGRPEVERQDWVLLAELLRPCSIEAEVVTKLSFEADRLLNSNLLAMLVEIASWEHLTVARIARDYKLNDQAIFQALRRMPDYFLIEAIGPKTIGWTPKVVKILEKAGVPRRAPQKAVEPNLSGQSGG
ncbi:hypothetical protein LCGC14_1931600 [marine sediment metagenome]|uniref:Uncharacterized protein n=1 Tax=marine sediment metagenome TaxID=412755 RepID=A0A0F9FNE7_9ZZZZ